MMRPCDIIFLYLHGAKTRNLSAQFPEIIEAVRRLSIEELVLDGEIVAVDGAGKPSFQLLQHIGQPARKTRPVLYCAFDLLNWEGKTTLNLPFLERKRLLAGVLHKCPPALCLVPFLEGDPDAIVAEIRRHNLEGIVAKLANSRYEPDKRSGAWSKFKCGYQEDFVIGGYTRGSGGRSQFGALIVGYYEDGRLRYASKVGSGFSSALIRQIIEAGELIRQDESPFAHVPQSDGNCWSYGLTATERKTAVWLKPVMSCRVRFTEWTRDGHLRHPTFGGLRPANDAT